MSYIGNQSENKVSPAFMRETLSPNGSATYFDLIHDVPGYQAENLLVTVNNVIQEPVNAYTIINDGNNRPRRLNFGVALASTDSLYVIHRGAGELYHTPPSNSVGASALQDNLKSGNVDSFTATAGQTAFTLSEIPLNANSIHVYVNGIFQKPLTNYTVTGSSTALTLSSGILVGDEVDVFHNTIRSTVSHVADASVTTTKIADGAISDAKLSTGTTEADSFNMPGQHVKIPSVTTTQRDALTGAVGMLIYNSTIGMLQQYNATGWAAIDSPPTVSSLNYPGDDTALDTVGEFALTGSTTANGDATITVSSTTNLKVGMLITGTGIPSSSTVASITNSTTFELSANATATGSANVTLTCNTQTLIISGTNFQTGVTVTIDGTAPSTVTKNSSTQITVTGTPAKTAGTKVDGLVVTNTSGLAASINVDYSALPAWTTASGNVLTANEGATISTVDLAATNATSYAITTGALPASLAMSTSTGDITGTLSASAATFNFTVTATDAEAQSSPRLFNIIVNTPPTATGGIITTYTGFKVHKYIIGMSEAFTFIPASSFNVDYLIVAGGGAGGGSRGAGGGAGGVLTASGFSVTAQTYTIVVGTGGAGASGTQGGDGVASTALGLSTVGGGGGAHSSYVNGRDGGSGGGAVQVGTIGDGTSGQGYDGGSGYNSTGLGAGGGGGAGAVGGDGSASGGSGGIGIHNSYLTGASGTTIATHYFAGGGGGGAYGNGGGSNSATNAYGGGRGRADSDGEDAIDNSGGGGGGGGYTTGAGDGGDGGNGIVIIRYAV